MRRVSRVSIEKIKRKNFWVQTYLNIEFCLSVLALDREHEAKFQTTDLNYRTGTFVTSNHNFSELMCPNSGFLIIQTLYLSTEKEEGVISSHYDPLKYK